MRYAYFGRAKAGRHHGILCFGYERVDNAVEYSMAFCSPKDNFSKKLAHLIIEGRFRKGRKLRLALPGQENLHNYEVLRLIINDYNTTAPYETLGVKIPQWCVSHTLCLADGVRKELNP